MRWCVHIVAIQPFLSQIHNFLFPNHRESSKLTPSLPPLKKEEERILLMFDVLDPIAPVEGEVFGLSLNWLMQRESSPRATQERKQQ
jgi:hypothetical protein